MASDSKKNSNNPEVEIKGKADIEPQLENKEDNVKNGESENEIEKPNWYRAIIIVLRTIGILFFLFFFICSLDLMAISFQLLAGETSNRLLKNSKILAFPITGLMVGLLVTVLVQSSSTSSSIFITMLAAGILSLDNTIYMLMGANIGTTITNTLVAFAEINDREEFSRAFAGATVHDMFNWLTVIILLPLEVVSGYLRRLSGVIVESMNLKQYKEAKQDLLKALTKPLTSKIIAIDKSKLANFNSNTTTIIKLCCKKKNDGCVKRCKFLFVNLANNWTDQAIGGLLLFLSLVLLFICLFGLVKILRILLLSSATESAKKFINSEKLGFFKGYIAIILGVAMTILLQSSSVFTSSLIPLVGTGFLSLELMFPLTLGSNIGTTVTGILAALAADNQSIQIAMQAAMVHLFFNISGIIIWYPIPYCRAVPIFLATRLGRAAKNHRWFGIVYTLLLFVITPLIEIGFAQISWILSVTVISIFLIIALIFGIVTCIQNCNKEILPEKYQNWKFLPKPMRSLDPYDKIFDKMLPCCDKLIFYGTCKKVGETSSASKPEEEPNSAHISSATAVNQSQSTNKLTNQKSKVTPVV